MNEPIKISKWEDLINVNYFINMNGLRATFDTKRDNLDLLLDVGNGYIRFKTYSMCLIDLKTAVDDLTKLGFNIKYEEKFNLVEFLEENLEPFAYEDEREIYIINLPTKESVYLVSTVNLNPLSCRFFGIISQKYDKDGINDILLENEIDSQQLIDAMEEIGWI